jgi:hypothetical protein
MMIGGHGQNLIGRLVLVGRVGVRGCGLFEFETGKIARKDSFWKIVE